VDETDNDLLYGAVEGNGSRSSGFGNSVRTDPGGGRGCDLAITCVHASDECHRCRGYSWMVSRHGFYSGTGGWQHSGAFFAMLISSQTRSSEGEKHPSPRRKSMPARHVSSSSQQRHAASQHYESRGASAQQNAHDMDVSMSLHGTDAIDHVREPGEST